MESENKLSTQINPKNPEIISYFDKEVDFVFIYKKTEKLGAAMYMITNLFPENEPLKWRLREKISELLSLTLTYKDKNGVARADLVNHLITAVLDLVSQLEMAHFGGLVSQMNWRILRQEFENLTKTLRSQNFAENEVSAHNLSTSYFKISKGENAPLESAISLPVSPNEEAFKRTVMSSVKDTQPSQPKEDLKKTNRQTVILTLIKKKKELTIKDIAEIITDCSEKTIQRELNSLIAVGVLKRTGVRRWSKYSLA